MERAGAARCLSEARRRCREAAAITTAAVTGTVPGVSTRDTGPCGTGSAGPVRWEGRVTSREGGPGRGRWFEAPLLLRAGSSNCDGTRGPRKRTTSRGRGSTAARAQNGLVPAARFYLGTPVPLGAWCPAAAPSAPGPAPLGSAVSRSPSGPCPVNSVLLSRSALPHTVILLAQPLGGDCVLFPFFLPPARVPRSTLLTLILAQASSSYLFAPVCPLPHSHQPVLHAFSTLYLIQAELGCIC